MEQYGKNPQRALLAVDCIIFGFDNEELKILLIKRAFTPQLGDWSLMGGVLQKNETLDICANRVLLELTGLHNVYMEQLHAFSGLDRDPIERTISVAYSALININDHDTELIKEFSAQWFSFSEIPDLVFDHNQMVKKAIARLRYSTSVRPVGFELLPEKFTMRQLQKMYEAILDRELDKRNFNKKVLQLDVLIKLDEKDMESSKKGSFLFKFDKQKYERKLKEGFDFKV